MDESKELAIALGEAQQALVDAEGREVDQRLRADRLADQVKHLEDVLKDRENKIAQIEAQLKDFAA